MECMQNELNILKQVGYITVKATVFPEIKYGIQLKAGSHIMARGVVDKNK